MRWCPRKRGLPVSEHLDSGLRCPGGPFARAVLDPRRCVHARLRYGKEFDGEGFAKKGVILVSINYRVNVFGFFAHPELKKRTRKAFLATTAFWTKRLP